MPLADLSTSHWAAPAALSPLLASFDGLDLDIDPAALLAPVQADAVWLARALRGSGLHQADELAACLAPAGLRNLLLATGLPLILPAPEGLDVAAFWRFSLNTAVAARWLAATAEEDAEQAFAAGLMHALGQLALHLARPQALRSLDADIHPLAAERAAAELALMGAHHGQASAALLRSWGVGERLAAPLAHVPEPAKAGVHTTLAATVHVAAWRARVALFGWTAAQAQASCPVAAGHLLDLPLAWSEAEATLVSQVPGVMEPMPPLAELDAGLGAAMGL